MSSAAYGSWQGGILSMRVRQARRLGTYPPQGEALARYVVGIGVVILHATNLVFVQSPWPYMVGVYFQLLVSFLAFRQLLGGAFRPPAA